MKVASAVGTMKQGGSIYIGNLGKQGPGTLKSTRQRQERQQKTEQQIQFWEQQKENLKNRECDSLEEIAKKLNQFHEYEEAIAATKKAYNMEQMSHVMDEAQERGEKIAEAVEKQEPKTEEERKKEAAEEAMEAVTGEEKSDGILSELMDQLEENTEQMEACLEEAKDLAGKESMDSAVNAENMERMQETEDLKDRDNLQAVENIWEKNQEKLLGKYPGYRNTRQHIDTKV